MEAALAAASAEALRDLVRDLVRSGSVTAEHVVASLAGAALATTVEEQSTSSAKRARVDDSSAKAKRRNGGSASIRLEAFATRYVAMRILYFGESLRGFAAVAPTDETQTVEGVFFSALQRTQLIADRRSCAYSRSGRTDKGVSAFCQVVALRLRSRSRAGEPLPPAEREINYVSILNGALPSEVRVTGWADVPPTFSARFSTAYRVYRYFFTRRDCDVEAMGAAAALLVGDHDFRNLCQMDAENVYNFRRRVLSARVLRCTSGSCPEWIETPERPADEDGVTALVPPSLSSSAASACRASAWERLRRRREVWFLEVVGHAFLWHQIRCIMGVLFLVGKHLESPTIVSDLLRVHDRHENEDETHDAESDATRRAADRSRATSSVLTPSARSLPFSASVGKPDYSMSRDMPLVLYHCHYAGLRMWCPPRAMDELLQHLEQRWTDHTVRAHQTACAIRALLRCDESDTAPVPSLLPPPADLLPGIDHDEDGNDDEDDDDDPSMIAADETAAASAAASPRGPAEARRLSSRGSRLARGEAPSFEEALLWTRRCPADDTSSWIGTAAWEERWASSLSSSSSSRWSMWHGPDESSTSYRTVAERMLKLLEGTADPAQHVLQVPDASTDYLVRHVSGSRGYAPLRDLSRAPTYAAKMTAMSRDKRRALLRSHPEIVAWLPRALGGEAAASEWLRVAREE